MMGAVFSGPAGSAAAAGVEASVVCTGAGASGLAPPDSMALISPMLMAEASSRAKGLPSARCRFERTCMVTKLPFEQSLMTCLERLTS